MARVHLVLAILLAAPLLATAPLAGADDGRCSPSGAAIANIAASGVTLQTQAGSQTFVLPLRQALGASTTGTLEVQVAYRCALQYLFSWVVTGTLSGTSSGSATVATACGSGSDAHGVPIGNDVASVHVQVDWVGCDGTAGSDARDGTVVDPAVPLPPIQ